MPPLKNGKAYQHFSPHHWWAQHRCICNFSGNVAKKCSESEEHAEILQVLLNPYAWPITCAIWQGVLLQHRPCTSCILAFITLPLICML